MAKPKQKVLVEVFLDELLHVWVDDRKRAVADIYSIEGVVRAEDTSLGYLSVSIDRRYDVDEIADEVRELLSSEIPDIFRNQE